MARRRRTSPTTVAAKWHKERDIYDSLSFLNDLVCFSRPLDAQQQKPGRFLDIGFCARGKKTYTPPLFIEIPHLLFSVY